MAFDFGLIDNTVLASFGASCTHLRGVAAEEVDQVIVTPGFGDAFDLLEFGGEQYVSTPVTVLPADMMPEEVLVGQYTVKLVRPDQIRGGGGVSKGDKFMIGATIYDVFAVKQVEGSQLARVYLSKA